MDNEVPEGICPVCQISPIDDSRGFGEKKSKTCGPDCARLRQISGTMQAARNRWLNENSARPAFDQFLYSGPREVK